MKKIILSILTTMISFLGIAQSVAPFVIASGGTYMDSGNLSLSYTIGQTVTSTLTNGEVLTQGFQQDSYTIVEFQEQSSQEFDVNIYPVPATNEITIEFSSDFQGNARIALIDELGRILSEKNVNTSVNKVSLTGFSDGYYFLKIYYLGNFKVYKIHKVNR